jgi:hypothetical protein
MVESGPTSPRARRRRARVKGYEFTMREGKETREMGYIVKRRGPFVLPHRPMLPKRCG